MLNDSKWDLALCHAPFLGHTGYANHAREFFTKLNERIPVRIRNFTHTSDIDYLTQKQKDMVIHQTWPDKPWEIGTPFKRTPKDKLINIIITPITPPPAITFPEEPIPRRSSILSLFCLPFHFIDVFFLIFMGVSPF